MPLIHLLYRCPVCGQDPVRGDVDRVTCPACGARFQRARDSARIEVTGTGGGPELLHPRELRRRMHDLGGALTAAEKPDGSVRYESKAWMSRTLGEDPVRRRGRVLGYAERFGPEVAGTLVVTEGVLVFESRDHRGEAWDLAELGAVQVSSVTLQVRPVGEAMVRFRFRDDSPLRWEELLQHLVREVYRELGRGEVEEFQPRIVAS